VYSASNQSFVDSLHLSCISIFLPLKIKLKATEYLASPPAELIVAHNTEWSARKILLSTDFFQNK
jgi:hypothetical protein